MLLRQDMPKVEIQYTRIINRAGNALAKNSIKKVFEQNSSQWRGIGMIKKSGLKIRDKFSGFDAESKFKIKTKKPRENKSCICGDVIKGVKTPLECRLFGKKCTPENPVGSCMVSAEGTCAAYYKYGRR